jgi:hypothetical protein
MSGWSTRTLIAHRGTIGTAAQASVGACFPPPIGGRLLVQGRARSYAAAARNTDTSSNVLPTICSPVGTPVCGQSPLGTEATGHWLTRLNG